MGRFVFCTGPVGADVGAEALRVQLAEVLADVLGTEVVVRSVPSYGDLLGCLTRGDAQIAWMPPAMVVRALDEHDVTLLVSSVRATGSRYHGVLFVRAGSAVREVEDLRGSLVAWVDQESSAGYLFPRMALADRGFGPDGFFGSEQMLGSHESVARAVEDGGVDCGATYANYPSEPGPGMEPTFAGWFPSTYAGAMRVVLASEAIPADALVAGKRLARDKREKIADVMCRLHKLPGGATLMQALFGASRFEPTLPRRYDVVRRAIAAAAARG